MTTTARSTSTARTATASMNGPAASPGTGPSTHPAAVPAPAGANAVARCAIVGAGGYSGAELVRLLLGHSRAEIVGVFASAKRGGEGASFASIFPRFAKRVDLDILPTSVEAVLATRPDVVFLATPNEVSHELAPALLDESGDRAPLVIDLSGAFRLRDASAYPKHYGFAHARPDLLASAVYGLAEHARPQLRTAKLVANPGCYPTAAILALRPLVEAKAIRSSPRPIIDAISGVSGAGRSADLRSHFCEVSVQPYGVLKHRHTPEIDLHAGTATIFTPHLGPYDRGILATMHATLADGVDAAQVGAILERAYGREPFVRLLADPSGRAAPMWPSVNAVRGTNCCDISYAVDPVDGHLVLVSAIDNLVKGAAGQAIQCMNIRLGCEETSGLLGAGESEGL
jgi:N-acetyl-gamma-glutamyl-phosphate reductase